MPIVPISTNQQAGRASVVSQILERGSNVLGRQLDNVISLGRQQANNQLSQEQSFLTEQRRGINLEQRKAEFNSTAQANENRLIFQKAKFRTEFSEKSRQFDQSLALEQDKVNERKRSNRASESLGFLNRGDKLELGRRGAAIDRQRAASGARNADANFLNAENNQRTSQARLQEAQNRKGEAAAFAQAGGDLAQRQSDFGNRFASADPTQRQDLLLREGSVLFKDDAPALRLFQAEAGVGGVGKGQIDAIDGIEDQGQQAVAEGIRKRLVSLAQTQQDPEFPDQILKDEEITNRIKDLQGELKRIIDPDFRSALDLSD